VASISLRDPGAHHAVPVLAVPWLPCTTLPLSPVGSVQWVLSSGLAVEDQMLSLWQGEQVERCSAPRAGTCGWCPWPHGEDIQRCLFLFAQGRGHEP
jgi:hypothetical protein